MQCKLTSVYLRLWRLQKTGTIDCNHNQNQSICNHNQNYTHAEKIETHCTEHKSPLLSGNPCAKATRSFPGCSQFKLLFGGFAFKFTDYWGRGKLPTNRSIIEANLETPNLSSA